MGRAQLLARVDPAILAAQPLAVEQVRAGELRTQPACGPAARSPRDTARRRPPRRSAAPGSAPRCRARSRCRRVASSPPAARAHRVRARASPLRAAASTSSGSAHMDVHQVRGPRWLAGPPTPPPRSGRGRCRGPRPPSAPKPPPSLALRPRPARSARDRCDGLGFPALQCREPQQRRRARWRLPVAAATLSVSAMSEAAPAKSPIHAVAMPRLREVERQLRERAGVADELGPVWRRCACMPSMSHSEGAGGRGHPAPPQDVLHGDVGERFRCPLQRRSRGGVSLGDQQREAVEQQVEGTRVARQRRERLHGAADLQEDAALAARCPAMSGRAPGGQVGLARELQVERLEPPRRVQQQRGSVAARDPR